VKTPKIADNFDCLPEQLLERVRRLNASAPISEFYQKGCQEKSSASTGDEMFSRDPAHGN
jgi:hypothetical protein